MLNDFNKNKNIVKTKLLYKFDVLNLCNFHKYIDKRENILVLVQTDKAIFGGYT